ncbi:response regulator [Methanolobus sediminis]|uniref:Response regulator n=1 Tax=Methanolobus sediminis TaxID=3072978 RepID=A0AA51ULW2_9EURY|nr:response regulator [Methanolobus sediminis]MDK2826778.1 two-component system, OmpR family, alkaline phosphatase synthesis response regulator PhoP [Methanolobus sp.]MDK2948319.1 two-component system, OmpR family, alkaline phosphatase synthesis response regulator PhoP [Methanolobus sp.]WMW25974.1 response regulator [Methanolobus sediminis]
MQVENIGGKILSLMEENPGITVTEISEKLSVPEDQVENILKSMSDTRQKILIVDDEMDALISLKVALEAEGYNVAEAKDGHEALDKVHSEKPDAILLDLMIPGIDGFEVCRQLKSDDMYRHIPIIMLTARGEIDDKVEGIELGADDYVTKPFNLKELKARVKMVLRRQDI